MSLGLLTDRNVTIATSESTRDSLRLSAPTFPNRKRVSPTRKLERRWTLTAIRSAQAPSLRARIAAPCPSDRESVGIVGDAGYGAREGRVLRSGGTYCVVVVAVVEDLFCLWCRQNCDAAACACVRLRCVWCGVGSGCRGGTQYLRGGACGEVERLWSWCRTCLVGRGIR